MTEHCKITEPCEVGKTRYEPGRILRVTEFKRHKAHEIHRDAADALYEAGQARRVWLNIGESAATPIVDPEPSDDE